MIIEMAKQEFTVEYVEDLRGVIPTLTEDAPRFFTYDTETTGLHIIKDRPFLGAVCWDNKVFVFETNKRNLLFLKPMSEKVKRVYGHNMTYDMHMTANMTYNEFPLEIENWGDTMGLARLSFESISKGDGGDGLGLKAISVKYLDPHANRFEKAVKQWLEEKIKADRSILLALIRSQGWTGKRFEAAMNKNAEPIPDEIMDIFKMWQEQYPEPNYQSVPLDIMVPYLSVDVILTKLLVDKSLPVVLKHKQQDILQMEFDLIPAVFDMERQGIEVDREYLIESGIKMDAYIAQLTEQMHTLAGQKFSVGQHKLIKDIYAERLGSMPESTDKAFLRKIAAEGDELAPVISKLRRLEKWKAVYIDKILDNSAYNGRFYTSMNQYNTVTGRFSGDAQQFPKDAITDDAGTVIYHPRRAFIMRGYYLDFSQVELRVQAHYTLKYGGDTNLCRAYMPFQCIHAITGETYDYTTVEGRSRWAELREGLTLEAFDAEWKLNPANANKQWEFADVCKAGWTAWLIPDTQEFWIPTDVHSATTLRALVAMGFNPDEMSKDEIKWWRAKGKTFNFMRNYGGGDKKASETLDITMEAAKAMNQGYTDAFPLVVTYQKGVERAMKAKGQVLNMSGRRYWLLDSWRFYKCANYLIQGSCADDLKAKMIKIWRWLRENGLKTRIVLCVHDELQFAVPEGEDWCIPHIKAVMEDAPEILVPIVAEVEFTQTTWNRKEKVAV